MLNWHKIFFTIICWWFRCLFSCIFFFSFSSIDFEGHRQHKPIEIPFFHLILNGLFLHWNFQSKLKLTLLLLLVNPFTNKIFEENQNRQADKNKGQLHGSHRTEKKDFMEEQKKRRWKEQKKNTKKQSHNSNLK